jgi:hypothetical protein
LDIEAGGDDCSLHIHKLDDGNRDHNWSDNSDYCERNRNFDVLHDDE